MCLHSTTGPGKPHMGSPKSVDVYVLLTQPPAPTAREWGTLRIAPQAHRFPLSLHDWAPFCTASVLSCLLGHGTILIGRGLQAVVKGLWVIGTLHGFRSQFSTCQNAGPWGINLILLWRDNDRCSEIRPWLLIKEPGGEKTVGECLMSSGIQALCLSEAEWRSGSFICSQVSGPSKQTLWLPVKLAVSAIIPYPCVGLSLWWTAGHLGANDACLLLSAVSSLPHPSCS